MTASTPPTDRLPTDLTPRGTSLINGADTLGQGSAFRASDPRDGSPLQPTYQSVTQDQLDQAMVAAVAARRAPIDFGAMARALGAMADEFEAAGDLVVATADEETALGEGRLHGELGRTVGQLRMMGAEALAGTRRGVTADPAGDGPAAPALFRTTVPLGIVGVFAASNFPLAFGVAGTDTAAALAAGCPVVAKAHPAQPATAELCGRLMRRGLAAAGLPAGFVQVLHEEGHEIGQALVAHPDTDAVAFTGSLRGGRALFDLAAARPRPIPVYAEMGSLNPLVVSPGAAAAGDTGLVEGILGSALQGEGQFCTKPGLVVLPTGPGGDAVLEGLAAGIVGHRPAHPLLHAGITAGFQQGLAALADLPGVTLVRAGAGAGRAGARSGPASSGDPDRHDPEGWAASAGGCEAAMLQATPEALLLNRALREELFGPVTVVVQIDETQLPALLESLDPALTATLHFSDEEVGWATSMADLLARKVGRVIARGYPTGVRVSPGQHHGGPYPATTSPLHTSVGLAAIDRFLRPVTFQSFDRATLPSWAAPDTA
ncbi:MAG TPA: aldehyde dehydrogenase family protein [Euzebya sp.]|nr:aldehyde dehydrogenase family protein [Euzebya sp.]